eukprot:1624413-Amphidinium_carterae.1
MKETQPMRDYLWGGDHEATVENLGVARRLKGQHESNKGTDANSDDQSPQETMGKHNAPLPSNMCKERSK